MAYSARSFRYPDASAQDICELYSFVCINYVDGDDIILIGFSRGAFTARAVADMIASLGLLTHDGLDHFFDVFEDYQLMGDKHRGTDEYIFKGLQPYDGEKGTAKILWEEERKRQYREHLKQVRRSVSRCASDQTA